jgi:hypothetical protein
MTSISGITLRSDITGVPAVQVFLYPLCRLPGDAGTVPASPLKAACRMRGAGRMKDLRGILYFFALPIAPLFLGFVEAGAFATVLGAGLVEDLDVVLAAGFPEEP